MPELSDFNVKRKDSTIHIYTDGSFGHMHGIIGAGWVRKKSGSNEIYIENKQEESVEGVDRDDQNYSAEFIAIAEALNEIENTDALIHMHTDFIGAIEFIETGHVSEEYNIPQDVQDRLHEALDRHDKVAISYATDKPRKTRNEKGEKIEDVEMNTLMSLAHTAAGLASMSNKVRNLSDPAKKYLKDKTVYTDIKNLFEPRLEVEGRHRQKAEQQYYRLMHKSTDGANIVLDNSGTDKPEDPDDPMPIIF